MCFSNPAPLKRDGIILISVSSFSFCGLGSAQNREGNWFADTLQKRAFPVNEQDSDAVIENHQKSNDCRHRCSVHAADTPCTESLSTRR